MPPRLWGRRPASWGGAAWAQKGAAGSLGGRGGGGARSLERGGLGSGEPLPGPPDDHPASALSLEGGGLGSGEPLHGPPVEGGGLGSGEPLHWPPALQRHPTAVLSLEGGSLGSREPLGGSLAVQAVAHLTLLELLDTGLVSLEPQGHGMQILRVFGFVKRLGCRRCCKCIEDATHCGQ